MSFQLILILLHYYLSFTSSETNSSRDLAQGKKLEIWSTHNANPSPNF